MESKILNFPEAMKLAQIISKYSFQINPNEKVLDFIDKFLSIISPEDYLNILIGFSSKSPKELGTIRGEELLDLFSDGLIKNKIISLLDTFSKLGK